jgi:hypothetical protein
VEYNRNKHRGCARLTGLSEKRRKKRRYRRRFLGPACKYYFPMKDLALYGWALRRIRDGLGRMRVLCLDGIAENGHARQAWLTNQGRRAICLSKVGALGET